jgi:hypothetical protein
MENELTPEQQLDAALHADLETKRIIDRYIRAEKAFEAATAEWNAACTAMRENLGKDAQFVARVDFVTYLVRANAGAFTVEKVKVLH